MSMAYKCNRCEKYHGYESNHKIVAVSKYGAISDDEYDLCPECKAEFDDFMKGAPAASLLERLRERLKKKEDA